MAPVAPFLYVECAEDEIAWLSKSFGAKQLGNVSRTPDGDVMHAMVDIFGAQVYLADWACSGISGPVPRPGKASKDCADVRGMYMHVNVPKGTPADVDRFFEQAVKQGATVISEPKQEFWGGYYACVRDPQGFDWGICCWPPGAASAAAAAAAEPGTGSGASGGSKSKKAGKAAGTKRTPRGKAKEEEDEDEEDEDEDEDEDDEKPTKTKTASSKAMPKRARK